MIIIIIFHLFLISATSGPTTAQPPTNATSAPPGQPTTAPPAPTTAAPTTNPPTTGKENFQGISKLVRT